MKRFGFILSGVEGCLTSTIHFPTRLLTLWQALAFPPAISSGKLNLSIHKTRVFRLYRLCEKSPLLSLRGVFCRSNLVLWAQIIGIASLKSARNDSFKPFSHSLFSLPQPRNSGCCKKKRMPSAVIPVARFMGIPESRRSDYSPATVEIPASHKTRAGMTQSWGLFLIICNIQNFGVEHPVLRNSNYKQKRVRKIPDPFRFLIIPGC